MDGVKLVAVRPDELDGVTLVELVTDEIGLRLDVHTHDGEARHLIAARRAASFAVRIE
jgi:hypothetical protein